jgi:hypothetical protein
MCFSEKWISENIGDYIIFVLYNKFKLSNALLPKYFLKNALIPKNFLSNALLPKYYFIKCFVIKISLAWAA